MPRPHSTMRQIREVLRLRFGEKLSLRDVAASLGVPVTTVAEHVGRFQRSALTWPLPDALNDDDALDALLFGRAVAKIRPEPDYALVHEELRQKGVTLMLLWHEYLEANPGGYQYTQFCVHYRQWRRSLDLVMRQTHAPGEKMWIDFPGLTIPLYDPDTLLEARRCELFVTTLGVSSLLYAEAVYSQRVEHWNPAHVRALDFYCGVAPIWVPDNLRSGVTQSHRYEPLLNASYHEMATHYAAVIIPARPYKPRDKAKVESAVQVAERWIIARLRHERFFSLAELNAAIAPLVDIINDRPFKKREGSRRSVFEEIDAPALGPLPLDPYEFATWRHGRVGRDYHVEIARHYYSVPFALSGKVVDLRVSEGTVEVFFKNQRVASHARLYLAGTHSSDPAHMPEGHRRYAEWTPERVAVSAHQIGECTAQFVEALMLERPHREQGFRSALGVVRLQSKYGPARLEAACTRALSLKSYSMRSVESILKCGLDRTPLVNEEPRVHPTHDNVRGPDYYQ